MFNSPYLRMIDASRMVVDDVNAWLVHARLAPALREQIYTAANSVSLNMAEGMGHPPGPERLRFLRYARASAEELNEGLFAARRDVKLDDTSYWRMHHRLVAIVRMIDSYGEKVRDTPVAKRPRSTKQNQPRREDRNRNSP